MKKITFLICTLAISIAMNAIVTKNPAQQLVKKTELPTIVDKTAKLGEFTTVKNLRKQVNEAFKDTVYLPYKTATTTYFVGKPDDGLGYDYYTQGLVTGYVDSIIFYNPFTKIYGHEFANPSWYLNGQEVASSARWYQMEVGAFDEFALPVMKTPTLTFNDSTILFEDFAPAGQWAEVMKAYSANYNNALVVSNQYLQSITLCDMYTDTINDSYCEGWGRSKAGALGNYAYGTKLINGNLTTETDTAYLDTIIVKVPNDGVMYISNLNMAIWTMSDQDDPFPGEDDHVRVTIYPLTEEGAIDWENPIASGKSNDDDYTPYSSDYKWLGLLNVTFTDVDPVTGAVTEVPAIVEGDFVLVFDEFNDGTADFGWWQDKYSFFSGSTYFAFDYQGQQAITPYWEYPANLLITFNVIIPAYVAPEEVTFGLDGGEKTFNIPTNIWDEDCEIETSADWITVTQETEYTTEQYQGKTSYIHKYINKLTVTVEESAVEREGEIYINALGLPVTIAVKQGAAQGIENVSFKNDNKLYNVLGQEVNEDYQGVVIRNGEKFIR